MPVNKIPVNSLCPCKSGKKYKKCCMNECNTAIINKQQDNDRIIIEGTLRLQNNIENARKLFGDKFTGRLIETKYFEGIGGDQNMLIQTLVCNDDHSIVLGKPSISLECTFCQVMIKTNPIGLLSVEVEPMYYHENVIINDLANLIEKRSVSNGWYGNCIMVSILFREGLLELGIYNNLEQGFICSHTNKGKYVLWHCWIQVNGHDIDISSRIARQLFPALNKAWETLDMRLSKIIPEDYDRIDQDTPQEIAQLVKLEKQYKLYNQSSSGFWADTLKDKEFHSVCDMIENLKKEINNFTKVNTERLE